MDTAVLRAMRDELTKISRFNPMSGKFIPEVGEKLLNLAKGAKKATPQASKFTSGGKFLPGPATPRGVVPPKLPSYHERASRILKPAKSERGRALQKQTGLAGKAQAAAKGATDDIRDPKAVLAMTLRGSGGNTRAAGRQLERVGGHNRKFSGRVAEAERMSTPVAPARPAGVGQGARDQMATGASTPMAMQRPGATVATPKPRGLRRGAAPVGQRHR